MDMKVIVAVVFSLVNLLLALSVLAWLPLGLLGAAFLAEAANSNPIAMALVLAILAYPVPIIAAIVGFIRHRHAVTNRVLLRYTLLGLTSPTLIFCLVLAWQLTE